MFGSQRDFDNRTAEYRSNLVGIKHLHRLGTQSESPPRPQPNQPITLHVTTSGGIAYDAVRCWMKANGQETTFELVPGNPYGVHLNGDMFATGMDRSHHKQSGQSYATKLADALWAQTTGFLRITKREYYWTQLNSLSRLTITICQRGHGTL